MLTAVDKVLLAGAEVFFAKGHSAATVADLLEKAQVPESTFRRYFKDGKVAVFRGVLEVAARTLYERFLKAVEQAGLDTSASDPKRLVLLYVETVIELWHSEGMGKMQVGLLFGADGTAAGQTFGKTFLTEAAMQDIELLDHILERGCGGDQAKAKNVSCIILGTLQEYVKGDIDSAGGYERSYEAKGIVRLLNSFLSSALQDQHITHEQMAREGVTREVLSRLGHDLAFCVTAVDRVLSATADPEQAGLAVGSSAKS